MKGYENGLMAAYSFINSRRPFNEWYGDGPIEICSAWLYLLEALNREEEYYRLKDKLDKERYQYEQGKR